MWKGNVEFTISPPRIIFHYKGLHHILLLCLKKVIYPTCVNLNFMTGVITGNKLLVSRWVLDGHKTDLPSHLTYAGIVSRKSVRIALTYAALNDLNVTAADIRNAYLQAPSLEKHYIVCGPEFGLENIGKRALIKQALYRGKSAGRDFRNHLRSCMVHMDFLPCPADPDLRVRSTIH